MKKSRYLNGERWRFMYKETYDSFIRGGWASSLPNPDSVRSNFRASMALTVPSAVVCQTPTNATQILTCRSRLADLDGRAAAPRRSHQAADMASILLHMLCWEAGSLAVHFSSDDALHEALRKARLSLVGGRHGKLTCEDSSKAKSLLTVPEAHEAC